MKPDAKLNRIFVWACIGSAAVWIATPLLTLWLTDGEFQKAGTFGDLYGSVNSLFSGFALVGVIIAIFLQQKELSQSTRELKNSATALTKQVELSADAARIQALPILMEIQKARIATFGGKYFPHFRTEEFTESWLQERIGEMDSILSTAEGKMAELRKVYDETPPPMRPGYGKDTSRDRVAREIGEWQDKLNVARSVLPEMKLLVVYLGDLHVLYKKMGETKLTIREE